MWTDVHAVPRGYGEVSGTEQFPALWCLGLAQVVF